MAHVPETFSLMPLFTAQGAVQDVDSETGNTEDALPQRLANWETAGQVARHSDWTPVSPTPSLRSGILMLRPENANIARHNPDLLREAFRDRGISLSTYPEGRLRLSMPSANWTDHELTQLSDGLRAVNKLFG